MQRVERRVRGLRTAALQRWAQLDRLLTRAARNPTGGRSVRKCRSSVSRQHDCSNRSGISVKRSTRGLSSFVNHPHLDIGAHALPRACRRLFLKLPQPRSRRARQVVALMLSNRLEVDFAQQSAIECMPQTSCSYLYHCGPIPVTRGGQHADPHHKIPYTRLGVHLRVIGQRAPIWPSFRFIFNSCGPLSRR